MKRRAISILIVIAMLGIILTSCGQQGQPDSHYNGTEEIEEQRVITMWTIATENDAFNAPFLKAIADYEEANPNVKIKMETFENQAYKSKLKSAVASNELPDIFFTWGGGFSKNFVESGKVLPLDEYYEEFKEELPREALSYATYDGVIYGTTYVAPVSMLFYNRAMFDKEGLTAPQTWEELLAVCEHLKAANITPLALSAKDAWVLAMAHDALALKVAGHDKVKSALAKEGQSYDDSDFLEAAEMLRELIDMGAFSEDAAELSNDEAQMTFTSGEAGMYIMASWTGGVIETDAERVSDFDVVPVPVLSDNAAATDFIGGAVDTLMVNAQAKDADIAARAAFEISRGVSKYAFLDGLGNAAWKIEYDSSSVNALSAKIADYTKDATSYTLWFDTLMEAEDAAEYLTLLQKLYADEIDAKGFVKGMDMQLSKK